MAIVASGGSRVARSDVNTSSFIFMIASTWTVLSSFRVQLLWQKTFSSFFSPSITITTSCFPVPSICFRDPVNDWFESLAQCLHWNVRKKQNYLSSEDEEFWGARHLRDPLQSLKDSFVLVLGRPRSVLCRLLWIQGLNKLHSKMPVITWPFICVKLFQNNILNIELNSSSAAVLHVGF